MEVFLDDAVHFDAILSDPATGAASDATGTPTFEVFENATDTDIGIGGNLTKRTSKTGDYRGTFTASAANGFEVGKFYNVVASATVGGVAGKALVAQFRVKPIEVAQTGDAYAIVNHADYGNAKLVRSTTPANTLDVAATGEAGVDLSNIKQATGSTTLTNITVPAVTTVGAVSGAVGSVTGAVGSVTGNVGGNVTGSVGSVVGAVGSVTGAVGSVTGNVGGNVAGTVASVVGNVGGNVTGTVASVVGNVGGNVTGSVGSVVGTVGSVTGAVGSVTGAVGSVTGNVGGNVAGSVASVTAGVTLADDAITSAKIATGAFTAAKFAADYLTAIITAVWTTAASRTLTAFGFSVTASSVTDKTGYSLAADQAVNVTKVGGTTVSGPDDLKATGFATHSAADVKTAIEASGSQLEQLHNTLVSDGVFSTPALANAPSGGGGGGGDATLAKQEEILDAIAALDVGGGDGSEPVTITVVDENGDEVTNANIAVFSGATLKARGTTEADGQPHDPLSINDGLGYRVYVTADGYQQNSELVTAGNYTLDVSGPTAKTIVLTANVPATHTDPALCIGHYVTWGSNGKREAGVEVTATLKTWPDGSAGDAFDDGGWTETSDENGDLQFGDVSEETGLFRGAVYLFTRGDNGRSWEVTIPDAGSVNLDPIAGSP